MPHAIYANEMNSNVGVRVREPLMDGGAIAHSDLTWAADILIGGGGAPPCTVFYLYCHVERVSLTLHQRNTHVS